MEAPIDVEPAPSDFVTTWQRVMRTPVEFFATMPEAGGLGEPIRFLMLVAALDAAGTLLVSWSVAVAVLAFVMIVVGMVLVATIATLVTQHLFEGRAAFDPVFRAIAYGSAPAVFFWIPWLAAIPLIYAWYLQTRGVERVQALDAGRASLAMLLSWVAVWLLARGILGTTPGIAL